jgi:hypothetical protein
MVPAVIDPDNSLWLHLLAIFDGNPPGGSDDPWDDQDLGGANCRTEETDRADISQGVSLRRIGRRAK